LQWSAPLLFTSPCYGALGEMLSISSDDALVAETRAAKRRTAEPYWRPQLSVKNLAPGASLQDSVARFSLNESGTLLGGNESKACRWCAQWEAEMDLEVEQTSFAYTYYPFDNQTIRLTLTVANAHLTTCKGLEPFAAMELTDETKNAMLLPRTREWFVDGDLASSIRAYHPQMRGVGGRMKPDLSSCVVEIRIARNSLVFIVKSLLITIFVVFASIFTVMYMHPQEMVRGSDPPATTRPQQTARWPIARLALA
jgi:hypothetical protein